MFIFLAKSEISCELFFDSFEIVKKMPFINKNTHRFEHFFEFYL